VKNKKEVLHLADQCMQLQNQQPKRQEILWLREVYERFYKNSNIPGKAEADKRIYQNMYDEVPKKPSDTLKIRYWRTGQHAPTNREQCLTFGKALDLTPAEMTYLMQAYYDRSDRIFDEHSIGDPEYQRRKSYMDTLIDEYLIKVHPSWRIKMKVSQTSLRHNIRHLYFSDAIQYVDFDANSVNFESMRHIMSMNYGSELNRNLKLFGEISRKTMIRHLIIFGMPYINRRILNEHLENLGYLPLREDHTLIGGEHLDWLLLHLLELYEAQCRGEEPELCNHWFQSACRQLDRYFKECKKPNLQFMNFKALRDL
jgi:hypothetical protein